MTAQRFDISIRSLTDRFASEQRQVPVRYAARVLSAPIDQHPWREFEAPVSSADLAGFHEAAEARLGDKRYEGPNPGAQDLGTALHNAVLGGDIGELYRRCRDRVDGSGQLELRLHIDLADAEAEYLGALPWELLYSSEKGDFLSRNASTPVTRSFERTRLKKVLLDPRRPLRILIVDAVPKGHKKLDLQTERQRLEAELVDLRSRGEVELSFLSNPTPQKLRDSLKQRPVEVLHFMGHGGYGDGLGAIFLSGEDGQARQVSGRMLAEVVQEIDQLWLVVLNACKTARHQGRFGAPLSTGVASVLVERAGIPAVVAHQHSISDEVAIRFTSVFYKSLAAGDGFTAAMSEVRLQERWSSWQWRTPVLFLNTPDQPLFRPTAPDDPAFTGAPALRRSPGSLRLGIRSFVGWGADMANRTDALLDLTDLFGGPDNRFIQDSDLWQSEAFPRLRTFLLEMIEERRPLLLDLAAHQSLAFAAGWVLEAKSGLDVRIRQRVSGAGEFEWHPFEGPVPEPLWTRLEEVEIESTGQDLALAVSASRPGVAEHVQAFLARRGPTVRRLIDAVIAPEPGPRSVAGGQHCLHLAQSLLNRLRPRRPSERDGGTHLFGAAPNALWFYLGQQSRVLGSVTLYEHPFNTRDAYGRYQASIRLPPPEEMAETPAGW